MDTVSTAPMTGHRAKLAPSVWLRRAGAVMLTAVIFLVDWLSTLDIAIAVLYVTVILMSEDLVSRRNLMIATLGCGVLTLAAYLMSHVAEWGQGTIWLMPSFGRCLVSFCAIAITGFLALKNKASKEALQRQVHLLNRSEVLLAGAQRLSLTGSIGLKMPGGEMSWSDEARRIFQFDHVVQPTLATMFSRVHPDDVNALKQLIRDAYASQANVDTEFRLLMPDGAFKCLRMLAQQIHDVAGDCEYVGALMDITATKNAEDALHRSQSQLAHVTRVTMLGEMAASIAHEVNQPLSAMTTNAEAGLRWLDREVPDIGEVRSAIERIRGEAHRASEVIRRIRALSRRTDPRHVQIDLQEVLHEAVTLVCRELHRHRVTLDLKPVQGEVAVRGDRVQLQQVIINLMINAMQAMAGMHGKDKTLTVQLSTSNSGNVSLSFQDNGPGISASNLPNLFNPFFTTKPEGMGMGLSICRSIIEAHGGRIWAESELGHGALLNLSLPAIEVSADECN